MSELVLLTGPPGAGKSTVAQHLVKDWDRALNMHTDDFYAWIARGFVPPWKPEAQAQNIVVMEAMAGAADRYCRGGYHVLVDGIVGPWFLDPWRALGRPIHYVVLRPSLDATEHRASTRVGHALKDLSAVPTMYEVFSDLGELERHVVDSSSLTPEATAETVRGRLDAGDLVLTS